MKRVCWVWHFAYICSLAWVGLRSLGMASGNVCVQCFLTWNSVNSFHLWLTMLPQVAFKSQDRSDKEILAVKTWSAMYDGHHRQAWLLFARSAITLYASGYAYVCLCVLFEFTCMHTGLYACVPINCVCVYRCVLESMCMWHVCVWSVLPKCGVEMLMGNNSKALPCGHDY